MNDRRIALITDSGTDTPAAFAAAHDVRVIPLRISYADGSSYESGVDITPHQLVSRFDEEVPTTSLPSPDQMRAAFERARDDGCEAAVFVSISSGLSATCDTARLVADQMPDFPTLVFDTKSVGIAAGLVVMEAARLIEAGVPFERLESELSAVARRTRVFFSVQTLDFLHKGGRIGEAVYRIGSVLNIKPVMTCDDAGRYVIAKKCRGWARALDAEAKLVAEEAARHPAGVRLALCAFEDERGLDELEAALRERVGNVRELMRVGLSADLLVHTGPSLVGVAVQGL